MKKLLLLFTVFSIVTLSFGQDQNAYAIRYRIKTHRKNQDSAYFQIGTKIDTLNKIAAKTSRTEEFREIFLLVVSIFECISFGTLKKKEQSLKRLLLIIFSSLLFRIGKGI